MTRAACNTEAMHQQNASRTSNSPLSPIGKEVRHVGAFLICDWSQQNSWCKHRFWTQSWVLGLICKTVNLVTNTLGWLRGMLSVNGKSHVIRHVLTLRIFGAPKKLCFRQNREEVFNQLNSTNWVELHKGYVQESRGEVTCRGHGVICIYK